ncbi:hypothetical protein, partial [Pseudomonas aeruginosa]
NRLIRCVCGKKIGPDPRILISESAWEEMTCLFAPSLAWLNDLLRQRQKIDSVYLPQNFPNVGVH